MAKISKTVAKSKKKECYKNSKCINSKDLDKIINFNEKIS